MLYFEFLEGVGLTAEDRLSWIVYKGLERIYDDTPTISKQMLYKYARPILRDLAEMVNDEIYYAKSKLVEAITEALTNTADDVENDEEDFYKYESMDEVLANFSVNGVDA